MGGRWWAVGMGHARGTIGDMRRASESFLLFASRSDVGFVMVVEGGSRSSGLILLLWDGGRKCRLWNGRRGGCNAKRCGG